MRFALQLVLALLCFGTLAAQQDAKQRPKNVLLILADDSSVDSYGCYGNEWFETPRLDALAAGGARFTNCHSTPVCTPSRVELMTGRTGIRNYVRFGTLHRDEVTFGTMLKDAGYATAIAGKWQLHAGKEGSLAPDHGFDTFQLWNYPGTKLPRFWKPSFIRNGEPLETTENDYGPDLMTSFLIDFIKEHQDEPFFAYYPMLLTHSPFLRTPKSEPPPSEETKKKRALRHFRDMTLYADHCVGRLVDTLEELGLREDTVILYTSDNGTDRSLTYPYGAGTRTGEKAFATEGGTHVPLIVNCPGTVPAGTVCEDLIDFSDFLPTLAECTGASLPDIELDGRSFWPQCLGDAGDPKAWIFQYYFPKFRRAAKAHGQGILDLEIAWVQDKRFKLYRDGTLYRLSDRAETAPIQPGSDDLADQSRTALQAALDAQPKSPARLIPPRK